MISEPEIHKTYTFKEGFNVSFLELQNLPENTERCYYHVSKLRGTYPDFEREPKHKGFIFDDFKWFRRMTKEGMFEECSDPYKKNEKPLLGWVVIANLNLVLILYMFIIK